MSNTRSFMREGTNERAYTMTFRQSALPSIVFLAIYSIVSAILKVCLFFSKRAIFRTFNVPSDCHLSVFYLLRYIHTELLGATTSGGNTDSTYLYMGVSTHQQLVVATKISGEPLVFHGTTSSVDERFFVRCHQLYITISERIHTINTSGHHKVVF